MLKSLNGIFMALIYLKISNTAIAYDRNDCQFAQSYNADDLLESSQLQEEFLLRASWWQGAFARNGLGRMGPLTIQGIEFIFGSQ